MALLFEEKDRTVVPNWRDFNRTLKLHELANNVSAQHIDISILRPLTDWRSEQNIGIAADLINSAFIAGKTNIPEVGDAINFVLANTENQSLISLAHTINGINVGGAVNKDDLLGNNIEVDPNNLNDLIFP